jgi:S-adenosylmethionine decarboxylase
LTILLHANRFWQHRRDSGRKRPNLLRGPTASSDTRETMRDLAPTITRQRLLIEGYYTTDVDEQVIRRFLAELAESLGLRTYGDATVFAPAGQGRDENAGYDAFVPLIDSGISLYVWTAQRFLALVVFTCKDFDADTAVEFTRDFFSMSQEEHQAF